MTKLESKIKNKKIVVGVMGLGYVGLPLVREFASVGLKVVGFDTDDKKVEILNSGRSIINGTNRYCQALGLSSNATIDWHTSY